PIDRATFVQMADRWLREGRARCGPWTGTISQTVTRKLVTPLTEDVIDAQIDIDVQDGDGTAHVTVTGHQSSKGQACESHRDDFKVDVQNIPVELNILVNSDMLGQVGLPGGLPVPANLPPGVPKPDFGPDAYTLIVRVTSDIKGSDHFEDH